MAVLPALPMVGEGGKSGFETSAGHHRPGGHEQERAGDARDHFRFLKEIAKLGDLPEKGGIELGLPGDEGDIITLFIERRAGRQEGQSALQLLFVGQARQGGQGVVEGRQPGRRFFCGGLDGGGEILQGGIDQGTTGERQIGSEATGQISAQRMADEVAMARLEREMRQDRAGVGEESIHAQGGITHAGGLSVAAPVRQEEAEFALEGQRGPQPAQAVDLQAVQQPNGGASGAGRTVGAGFGDVQFRAVVVGDGVRLPVRRNQVGQGAVGADGSGVGMWGCRWHGRFLSAERFFQQSGN